MNALSIMNSRTTGLPTEQAIQLDIFVINQNVVRLQSMATAGRGIVKLSTPSADAAGVPASHTRGYRVWQESFLLFNALTVG